MMVISGAVMLVSVHAYAGGDFDKYDADGNGVISKDEASSDSALAKQFSQLDTNNDGELSKEEFANFSGK